MYPLCRLTIPTLLLAAGCPTTVIAADGWLSLMLEGSIQPMHYDRTSDVVAGDTVYSTSENAALDLAWRAGATALMRVPTATALRPAIGCALSLDTFQHSAGGGESDIAPNPPDYVPPTPAELVRYDGHIWTWDLLVGMSYLINNHVIIDILPFIGIGKGHATSSHTYKDGDWTTYNPDLKMKEIGIRGGITFIGDFGPSFTVFSGYCRREVDEDGYQYDTLSGLTTANRRTDTTTFKGFHIGIGVGFTL